MNNLEIIQQDINAIEHQFNDLSSFGKDVKNAFARESNYAMQVFEANSFASRLAVGSRQSVINAVLNVAAIGLSLNPAEKEAYLVPRNGKICLDLSYIGLMRLATDTGQVEWVQANIVHEKDDFQINGLDKQPTHKYKTFDNDRGEAVGVYVTAKLANGDYLTGTMTVSEVNEIRDKSQSYIGWVSKGKKGSTIWVDHWGEMAKKTIVKRESKYWPKSERLNKAIHVLNTESDEGFADVPVQIDAIEKWTEAANKATSIEETRDVWAAAAADFKITRDFKSWDLVKVHILERIADFEKTVENVVENTNEES